MIKLGAQIKTVLDLTLQGQTQQQIAVQMNLSRNTVKKYRHRLYRHFSVNSKQALCERFQ